MARTAKKSAGAYGTGGDGVSTGNDSRGIDGSDGSASNADSSGADYNRTALGPKKADRRPADAPSADSVLQLLRLFEQSEEASATPRTLGLKARRYVNNEQWTREELKELELRGQPPSMQNKIKPKIDYLTGLEIKRRTQPKVFPRQPVYQDDADAATQVLRYECDQSEFAQTKSEVWDELLVEGGPTGALIAVELKNGKPKLRITHTPWDRVFVDPHARKRDFSDARYKGIVIWMDKDDAQAQWPDRQDAIVTTIGTANGAGISYDDRPQWVRWVDPRRQRVRIIEIYYKLEGDWWQATLTQGGYLVDPAKVVYVDEEGETECPLELISNYRKQDNSCFGVVEELIPRQDEINKRHSKFLHQITMRQARISRKANQGQKIKQELAKPDGTIVADKDEFEILDTGDMAEGQFKLLMQSSAEMDQSTANAALTGTQADAPSGRAILANQQGGQVQQETPLDRLRMWQVRVFTQVWNRIRQYWTKEQWVSITGDPRNMRWVGINLPMTQADLLARKLKRPITDHERARLDGQDGRPHADAVVMGDDGQPLIKHSPAEIMANIIIDEGPDTVTIAQEQWQGILQLPPNVLMAIPPMALVEMSSLPNKDKIIEMMKAGGGGMPPGQPAPGQPPGIPGAPPQGPQAAPPMAMAGPGGPAPQPGLGGAPMPSVGTGSMGGPGSMGGQAIPPGGSPAILHPQTGAVIHPALDAGGNPLPPPMAQPLDPSQIPAPVGPEHVLAAADADHAHELAKGKQSHDAAKLEHDKAEADHRRGLEGRKQTLAEKQHELAEKQFALQNPHAQQIAQMMGALGEGQDMSGHATPGMVLAQSVLQLAKFIPAIIKAIEAPTELVYDTKGDVVGSRKLGLQTLATETLADLATPVAGTNPMDVLAQAAQIAAQNLAQAIPAIVGAKTITQGPGGRPDEIQSAGGGDAPSAPPPGPDDNEPPQQLAA